MGAATGTLIELDAGIALVGVEYKPNAADLSPSNMAPISPLVTLGFFTDAAHEDLRIGLSVGIPRTQGGAWGRDDGAAAITRYYMVEATGFHLSIAPAVSYSPTKWLTIGAAAHIVYGSLVTELDKDLGAELNVTAGSSAVNAPFPYAHPDMAAPVLLDVSGVGIGAIIGIYARPIPELSLGLSFHTPVSITSTGTVDVTYSDNLTQMANDILPAATLPELSGNVEVDLSVPWQIIVGLSAKPIPGLEIAAAYRFERTSDQPNFNVDVVEATSELVGDTTKPQAYRDRHVFSLRGTYAPTQGLVVGLFGRFQTGIVPEETQAPNNLDFDRLELGAVGKYRIVEEFSLLLQYGFMMLMEEDVQTSLHRPVTQASLAAFNHPSPTGLYSGSVHSIRLGLILHL